MAQETEASGENQTKVEKPLANPEDQQRGLKAFTSALVVLFPLLKVLYDVNNPETAAEILRSIGPTGWLSVALDQVLSYPVLYIILYIVVSNWILSSAFWEKYVTREEGDEKSSAVVKALVAVMRMVLSPMIIFLSSLVFFGLTWALIAVAANLIGQLSWQAHLTYKVSDADTRQQAKQSFRGKLQSIERWFLRAMVLVVLPASLVVIITDGESWAPVRICSVESVKEDDQSHEARVVELKDGGSGDFIGWEVGTENIVSANACVADESQQLRDPWIGK